MQKIALIAIFATAFAITANMHIYVQSLRLSIYAYHIFLPVIPINFMLALGLGHLVKLDRPTILYMLWWALFLLVIALSIVIVDGGPRAVSEGTRYTMIAAISLSFLALAQTRALAIAGALGIACATLFAAGVSFAEFLNPDFTMVVDQRYERDIVKEDIIGRVGGLHLNPNGNARLMTLGMFASCFFLPQKYRVIYCLFVGCAVFMTVSRSGMITWSLAIVILTALGQIAPGKLIAKFVGFSFIAGLAILLSTGAIPSLLESVGLDEYMSEKMIERLSSGFLSQDDGSTNSRKELAVLGLELYADHPIAGAGLGSATTLGDTGLGPHNTALGIAAETGTFGAIIYFGLFLIPIALRSIKGGSFLLVYTVSSMFGDGLMNLPTLSFILPTGIILLCKLDERKRKASRSRQRKRSRRARPSRARITQTA